MTAINPMPTNLLQNRFAGMQMTNPIQAQPQPNPPADATEVMPKDTADAVKAYALVQPQSKPTEEKKNFETKKQELISQGKTEGKDFIVDKDKFSTYLQIMENGKPTKEYCYENDGELECVRDFSYPINSEKGLKSIRTTKGTDGEFRYRTFEYDKEDSPYKNEIVNCETKSSDFMKYLIDNKIKFANDLNLEGDIATHKFTVFDEKSKEMVKYEITEDISKEDAKPILVYKNNIDEKGNTKYQLAFSEYNTSFTEYDDSFKA